MHVYYYTRTRQVHYYNFFIICLTEEFILLYVLKFSPDTTLATIDMAVYYQFMYVYFGAGESSTGDPGGNG